MPSGEGVDCLLKRGNDPVGDQMCTTAAAMYHEMDMRFWLDRAEATG